MWFRWPRRSRNPGSERAKWALLACAALGAAVQLCLVVSWGRREVAALQAEAGLPVVFGVLTTDTLEQAMDRAGAKCGNKGAEAAVTAVEMVHVYQALAKPRRGGAKKGKRS